MLDFASVAPLVAATATAVGTVMAMAAPVVMGLGLVPRAGPGRAFTLALRSRFAPRPSPVSARVDEVAALHKMLAPTEPARYAVVLGPKGVGKTCVVQAALQRTCGVVVVQVSPGAKQDAIVRAAFASAAGIQAGAWLDPLPSARRVLWWYRLLLPPPVVVLRVSERPVGGAYAETAGAARDLLGCGFRAVVDSSPNSLEPRTLSTHRQDVLEIAPMPRSLLFSLPEFAELFEALRSEGLGDVAWAVLGGVPVHYTALREVLQQQPRADFRRAVERYLREQLRGAISRYRAVTIDDPNLIPILRNFETADEISEELLASERVKCLSADEVLRAVVTSESETVFVPSDNAVALVLRHGFEKAPSIATLQALCATPPRTGAPTTSPTQPNMQ